MEFQHIPVLKDQVQKYLNIKNNGVYIDCTAGGGGHLRIISENAEHGTVYGIDQDKDAVKHLNQQQFKNAIIVHSNFSHIRSIVEQYEITEINGILADLGVSTYQLKNSDRGFSFLHNGPLDMRMNVENDLSARDVVNTYTKNELFKIIKTYGEEKKAGKIASEIVKYRKIRSIETTEDLVKIIDSCFSNNWKRINRIHPATRTFQALRIEVNHELEILENALADMIDVLSPGGRIVIISFHSLEDRIVKHLFKYNARTCICPEDAIVCTCSKKKTLNIITKKPIIPENKEILENPAARSSKLRAAEKV